MLKVIKSIFSSKQATVTKKQNIANQCDFREIFRPKKQSEKPCITVTTITALVLQATADSYDARDQGIKAGLIMPEMNDMEAIACPLAFYVFQGFEERFSPKLTLSFLDNYCLEEIQQYFMLYYIKIANHFGVNFTKNNFANYHQVEAIMDIEGISKDGDRLNLKAKNNPFKEPYRSVWIKNLS